MIQIWKDGDRTWLYDDYYHVVWLAGSRSDNRVEKFLTSQVNVEGRP